MPDYLVRRHRNGHATSSLIQMFDSDEDAVEKGAAMQAQLNDEFNFLGTVGVRRSGGCLAIEISKVIYAGNPAKSTVSGAQRSREWRDRRLVNVKAMTGKLDGDTVAE